MVLNQIYQSTMSVRWDISIEPTTSMLVTDASGCWRRNAVLVVPFRPVTLDDAGLFWKVYIFSHRSYDHSKSNLEWHYWIKLSIFFRIWKISVRVYSCFFALEFGSVWTLKIQPLCVSSTSAFFTSQRLKKLKKWYRHNKSVVFSLILEKRQDQRIL